MVDGNRYFRCDGFGEVGLFDEVGGLTVGGWGGVGWLYKMYLKGGRMKKGVGRQKWGAYWVQWWVP